MSRLFNVFFLFVGIFLFSSKSFASSVDVLSGSDSLTVSLNVYGTNACKSTIESISKTVANVSSANFNADTHTLILVVLPSFDQNSLFFLFASKGYDAGNVHAKDAIYNQLSDECKYVRMPDEVVRD